MRTRSRLIAAAVSTCFVTSAQAANLPTGGVVAAGSASFNQIGNVLNVTNSNGAIINWNTFGIGAGYTTNFIQPSVSSSVLNRVLSNDPSVILGNLTSNGRVFLINPNGIMVGQGARIDVAGFVASTLNLSDANFLANKLTFDATPAAGSVVNQGSITTPQGGTVYLVAPNVSNEGIITTPKGETILAAGQTVTLVDTATPGVSVEITGAAGNATNLGQIIADAGRIGIAGVIARNSGTLNASSVVNEGGRIFLKASQDAYVDGNGRIVTTGSKGGNVQVLGNRVAVMDSASIDASGTNGGGTVLVGGDYQGKNPDIQNATVTYFGPNATIKANATNNGNGGKVIVWADDTTRAFGTIEAKGGTNGGNGGFIETSGHRYLDVAGIHASAAAPHGVAGTWLLDPGELTIVGSNSSYGGSFVSGVFTTGATDSMLSDSDINAAIDGGTSVSINTNAGYSITFDGAYASAIDIQKNSGLNTTLTIASGKDIVFKDITKFETKSGSGALTVKLETGSGGKVTSYSSDAASVELDGQGGHLEVFMDQAGKTWENSGTITLKHDSTIKLIDNGVGGVATLWNQASTGLIDIQSTAGWSFLSNSGTQAGLISNDGTITVKKNTSWEARFDQSSTGTLKVGDVSSAVTLSMQNAGNIAGNVEVGDSGGTALATLVLSENTHGVNASFSGATIKGTPTGLVYMNSAAIPHVSFNSTTFNNATVAAQSDWTMPTSAVYQGDNRFFSQGNLTVNGISGGSINNSSGALTLMAGWNGASVTAPSTSGGTGSLFINATTASSGTFGVSVNASTTLDLEAANNITLTAAANPGSPTSASGVWVQSGDAMTVKAGGTLKLKASDYGNYGSAVLYAGGGQDITANRIEVYGGATNVTYGGHLSYGSIENHGTGAGQVIHANQIYLAGGGSATTDYSDDARIYNDSTSGQSIYIVGAGGSITGKGGHGGSAVTNAAPAFTSAHIDSGCFGALGGTVNCAASDNSAVIENKSTALQYVAFDSANPGGAITFYGGDGGANNRAGIKSTNTISGSAGNQTIDAYGANITLYGGASGGRVMHDSVSGEFYDFRNQAGIESDGTTNQIIGAGAITLNANGGANTVGGALIGGGPTAGGGNFTIEATSLTLNGGAGSVVSAQNDSTAYKFATPAAIGSDKDVTVTLNVGTLTVNGGTGAGGTALIGSLFGTPTITVNATGNVALTAGTGSGVVIGSMSSSNGSTVTINSNGGTITAANTGNVPVLIGSVAGSSNVTMHALGNIVLGATTGTPGAVLIGSGAYSGLIDIRSAHNVTVEQSAHVYGGDINIMAGQAYAASTPTASLYGGSVALNNTILATDGGDINIDAHANASGANGAITQTGGTMTTGGGSSGEIWLRADRDVTVSGTLEGGTCGECGGVFIDTGYFDFGAYGGDIKLNAGSNVISGAVGLTARYGSINAGGGRILQAAGGYLAVTDGYTNTFVADRDVQFLGDLKALNSSSFDITAGYGGGVAYGGQGITISALDFDSAAPPALGGFTFTATGDIDVHSVSTVDLHTSGLTASSTGGNITFTANTSDLVIDGGTFSVSLAKQLKFDALAGDVNITSSVNSNGNLYVHAGNDISANGVDITADNRVTLNAGRDITVTSGYVAGYGDGTGGGATVTAGRDLSLTISGIGAYGYSGTNTVVSAGRNISMTSSGIYAYDSVSVTAGGTLSMYGGNIGSYGFDTAIGTTVNAGSLVIDGAASVYGEYNAVHINAGSMSMTNSSISGYYGVSITGGPVTLTSSSINGYHGVSVISGSDVSLTNSSINADFGGVGILARNLSLQGYSYINSYDSTSNIEVLVQGSVNITNSAIISGNDVILTLNSGDSVVNLDDGSGGLGGYIWSDSGRNVAGTTIINFNGRSSGGVLIDGADTTTTTSSAYGGSGIFGGIGHTASVLSEDLIINYASSNSNVAQNVIDQFFNNLDNGPATTDDDQKEPEEDNSNNGKEDNAKRQNNVGQCT